MRTLFSGRRSTHAQALDAGIRNFQRDSKLQFVIFVDGSHQECLLLPRHTKLLNDTEASLHLDHGNGYKGFTAFTFTGNAEELFQLLDERKRGTA